jgi:hypothetical protein
MVILGVAEGECELQTLETQLKEAGLYGQYESQIKGGQGACVTVRVRDVTQKEQVRSIFEKSGVIEISYKDEELTART